LLNVKPSGASRDQQALNGTEAEAAAAAAALVFLTHLKPTITFTLYD